MTIRTHTARYAFALLTIAGVNMVLSTGSGAQNAQPLPTAANPNNTYSFNPCPITSYTRGYGGYNISTLQRHQLIASVRPW